MAVSAEAKGHEGEGDISEEEVEAQGAPGPALQAGHTGERLASAAPPRPGPEASQGSPAFFGHAVGCEANTAGPDFLLRPWGTLLNLSEPQCPLLQMGGSHLRLVGCCGDRQLGMRGHAMQTRHSAEWLPQRRCSEGLHARPVM